MEEPGFVTLRMKRTCCRPSSGRHAHHNISLLPPSPVDLGEVIYDLVESLGNKISELHLHHGFHPFDRKTKPCANNSSLTNRCVANTRLAEFFNKTFSDFEYTSVFGNVLPHQHQVIEPFHALTKPVTDRI